MALVTTSIDISTTPAAVISTGTTWAHLRGASLNDPVPFTLFNDSVIRIHVGGSSAITSAQASMPVLSSGYLNAGLIASEPLFAVTSGSTATIRVSAGRQ